jgi:hypothetical protein
LLTEDLRAFSNIKERATTAAQIRDIVKQANVYAIAHGEKIDNLVDSMSVAWIATFVTEDRASSLLEIRQDNSFLRTCP